MKVTFLLCLLLSTLAFSHGGGLDKQGGHFNRTTNIYQCPKEPCFSIQQKSKEAYEQAKPGTFSRVYNRKDWPHWIDADGDCQNTRQELLVATSKVSVRFKNAKRCTVKYGKWHGADCWTKAQRRIFANDSENLLVVNDATNQAKSDQAPHEWLPPQENYWCEYGKRWERIKDKYGLRYSNQERIALNSLAETR